MKGLDRPLRSRLVHVAQHHAQRDDHRDDHRIGSFPDDERDAGRGEKQHLDRIRELVRQDQKRLDVMRPHRVRPEALETPGDLAGFEAIDRRLERDERAVDIQRAQDADVGTESGVTFGCGVHGCPSVPSRCVV